MKKTVFLMLSGMAIFISGCTGSGSGLYSVTGTRSALINTNTPVPLKNDDIRGVCLSISPRSSLNIDVECILDYVQGEAAFDPTDQQEDLLNPWVRWRYAF
ncbi:hypothetical protein DSCA_00130 [Desulfosarcina alkanivorans]|uniref:Lipoprotein n=1 Tax=Desulfosarcina alkanivorans TaxID=571177 RepID=A0A5K7YBX0_9BACT|nr:hypothetical protein [Desulfosarcina alkanivorans]BBO66083.1 hypothetical protein DSCA_00130 [Desulfosarcina alkanivorans]